MDFLRQLGGHPSCPFFEEIMRRFTRPAGLFLTAAAACALLSLPSMTAFADAARRKAIVDYLMTLR